MIDWTKVLRFGDYLLDAKGSALYHQGRHVKLRGKPLDVLLYLANHSDQIVSKDILLKEVWHGEQKSENCVEEAVYRARTALDDNQLPYQFIGTRANGYNFVPDPVAVPRSELPQLLHRREFMSSYVVQAATAPDISWAAKLAEMVYTGQDVIPEKVMLDWYRKNSCGFFIVRTKSGSPSGNLDLLPIKPLPLQNFISGRTCELDLTPDDLYSEAERAEITDLYVESLVSVNVTDAKRPKSNPIAAAQFLAEFDTIVRHICRPDRLRRIYAIGASRSGRRLLTHLGFEICTPKDKRLDKHDLYCAPFDQLESRLTAFFGDGRRDATAMKLLDDAETDECGL